jgi:hypothetical protein
MKAHKLRRESRGRLVDPALLPRFGYDLKEAAVVVGVSVTMLRRAIRDKALEVRRIGTRIVVTDESLRRFLAQDWRPEKKDAA